MPLLVFERQGNRILVMCWYQMGNELFFNRAGLGTTRMAFRGEKVWPAAVKVLLQTTASDVRQAQDGLADFATRVYEWTRDMQ
jgi:formylglycine-generating enzyme required for sulfatase activity